MANIPGIITPSEQQENGEQSRTYFIFVVENHWGLYT